ncbi:hypothetical protein T10_161 [Trichinella papuae]|uniref:Uncharacterized protein n=1 Tax=Trichinella papuae TaxID=268474 RepID=A0A0V1M953_9BILA|nr:hypothetical protein T10_161 [Trichinella papuae]
MSGMSCTTPQCSPTTCRLVCHQDGSRRSLVVLKQWYAVSDHHSTCDAKQLWGKATFTGEIAAGEAPLALPGLRCRCHLTAWRIRQPSMVFQVWPIAVILTHHFRGHRISREASGEEAIPEAMSNGLSCGVTGHKAASCEKNQKANVPRRLIMAVKRLHFNCAQSDQQVVSYVLTNVTILLMIRLLTTTAVSNFHLQAAYARVVCADARFDIEALPTGSKSQRKGADFQLADSTVSIQNAAVNLRDCLHFEFLILADHIEEQPVMTDLHIRLQIPFDVISVQLYRGANASLPNGHTVKVQRDFMHPSQREVYCRRGDVADLNSKASC